MAHDKRFKRFKEFVEDTSTRPMGMSVAPKDYKKCPECNGQGKYPGPPVSGWGGRVGGGWGPARAGGTCIKCQGTGYVHKFQESNEMDEAGGYTSCPTCAGKGELKGGGFCPTCHGTGQMSTLGEDADVRNELKVIERKGRPAWQFREFIFQGTTKEHNSMAGSAQYMPADELYDKLKRGVYAPGGRRVRIWKTELNEDGAGGGAGGGGGAVGGAPANSAGAGNIAGLGVPAGSKFGEPGGRNPLGGYTSGKKRKHYKEDKREPIIDVMEWDQIPKPIEGGGMFPEEVIPKGWTKEPCRTCGESGKEYGETCVTCGGSGYFYIDKQGKKHYSTELDEETSSEHAPWNYRGHKIVWAERLGGLWRITKPGTDTLRYAEDEAEAKQKIDAITEELSKDDIETAAAAVHDQWMDNQKKSGHTEHKSPDGKEDYMVPYDELKDKSKKLDRDAVKATIDALKLDEAQKRYERVRCSYCRGSGQDWEDPCSACAGHGYILYDRLVRKDVPMWDTEVMDDINQNELMEEREMFAGAPVFEVDTDKWMKSRFGKNRYHRYSRYVGEDEQGEAIRQHGRTKRKEDIILKDQATGAMTYFLRRKKMGR